MLTALRTLLRSVAKSLGVERAAYTALIDDVWAEVVGPEAGAHTRPVGLRGKVLLVDAEGLWAQDLSARRAELAAEINRALGGQVVGEIRVRQVARLVRSAGAPAPAASAAEELSAEEREMVERAAAEVSDPELREVARRAWLQQLAWRKRHVRPSGR